MGKKTYKLFSAQNSGADNGAPPPCAFFATEKGCKSGDNCKFSHDLSQIAAAAAGPPPVKTEEAAALAETKDERKKKKRKKKKDSAEAEAAEEEGAPAKESKPLGTYAAMALDEEPPVESEIMEGKFLSKRSNDSGTPGAAAVKTDDTTASKGSSSKRKKRKNSESQDPPSYKDMGLPIASLSAPKSFNANPDTNAAAPSFRHLGLPVAPVSAPSNDAHQPPPTTTSQNSLSSESSDESSSSESSSSSSSESASSPEAPSQPPPPPPPKEPTPQTNQPPKSPPVPESNPLALKWKPSVLATQAHPRYKVNFNFEKKRAAMASSNGNLDLSPASDWVTTKPYGAWCATNPVAVAVDCEMCETKDPVTGAVDSRALCRVSVIDASKTGEEEVLLDTLVKPAWPVANYRSEIHGITADMLEPVQFTLRHAQAFLMALCSEETVIIGHSVDNDLAALKLQHYCVVDTALLYKVKGNPRQCPGLKDIVKSELDLAMPTLHDAVNDARMALKCADLYATHNGKVKQVIKEGTKDLGGEDKANGSSKNDSVVSLLVHRIPLICKEQHIEEMFVAQTCVHPVEVNPIDRTGKTGKTMVRFSSPEHADLSFRTLKGGVKADSSGRMQKRVYLVNGDYVVVRC